jgi:hypothetical protein
MKKHKKIIRLCICLAVAFTFSSCDTSDDDYMGKTRIPLFDQSNLEIIHGGSQKSWKITEYINIYHNPKYSLEVETPCLTDDVYTFSKDKEEVEIVLGDSKCFGQNSDGIFTADIELFSSKISYFEIADSDGDKTIFFQSNRGYVNTDNTAMGSSSRWYKLAELTEDRMVFHREGGNFIGDYREALVFEKQ